MLDGDGTGSMNQIPKNKIQETNNIQISNNQFSICLKF